jgi:hypothetical protein
MNTRPSSMTPEEIERILKAVETQGASIRVSDPRLSQIIAWAAIALGTLFTGAVTWGVKSVSDLNTNVAILIEQRKTDREDTQRLHEDNDRIARRLEALEQWRLNNERGR